MQKWIEVSLILKLVLGPPEASTPLVKETQIRTPSKKAVLEKLVDMNQLIGNTDGFADSG